MSCSICEKPIDKEKAPILSMGGMGYPRYLCDECAAEIECATEGKDADEIRKAISAIADKVTKNNIDDGVVIGTVHSILKEARVRAERIEAGEAVDTEEESEELEDIPEELLESEEDRALDEEEAVKKEKSDKIFNWISAGVLAAAIIGFLVYLIFFR